MAALLTEDGVIGDGEREVAREQQALAPAALSEVLHLDHGLRIEGLDED